MGPRSEIVHPLEPISRPDQSRLPGLLLLIVLVLLGLLLVPPPPEETQQQGSSHVAPPPGETGVASMRPGPGGLPHLVPVAGTAVGLGPLTDTGRRVPPAPAGDPGPGASPAPGAASGAASGAAGPGGSLTAPGGGLGPGPSPGSGLHSGTRVGGTRAVTNPPMLESLSVTTDGSLGGALVRLVGSQFSPVTEVVVHWGNTVLDGDDLVSITPTGIVLSAPPHSPGSVFVSVETPAAETNSLEFTYTAEGTIPVQFSFDPSVVSTHPDQPTCGAWGPDGRFYVGTLSGKLYAITFNQAYVGTKQQYDGVSNETNYQILGLAFSPWDPADPVKVYVSHTQLYAQGGGAFSGPSPYPGQVSVLTGPDFDMPESVITGLPTSNHDHGPNGMEFDHDGDLLLCMGGNTDAGIQHPDLGDLPESPLSGAILKAELSSPGFSGLIRYSDRDPPHLPNNDQVFGESVVTANSGVEVFASGFRNPFDLVLHTNGLLYATDNGPNPGFGGSSTGPSSDGGDVAGPDELCLVTAGDYYGHPNRSRGHEDGRQNVYHAPSAPTIPGVYTEPLLILPSSSNGIDEYRATTFHSAMRGDLLTQHWIGPVRHVELAPDGLSVDDWTDAFAPTTTFSLNIKTGPGGAILGMHWQGTNINVLEPVDTGAVGVTAYDIHPWRAPASGGTRLVIGGANFALGGAPTAVTIGGNVAEVVSVSAKRIVVNAPPETTAVGPMLDVVVTSGRERSTIPAAFRYLSTGRH